MEIKKNHELLSFPLFVSLLERNGNNVISTILLKTSEVARCFTEELKISTWNGLNQSSFAAFRFL